MGYRSKRLFKGAVSGQKNPEYCGAETALGFYNRHKVARRNAHEKGQVIVRTPIGVSAAAIGVEAAN